MSRSTGSIFSVVLLAVLEGGVPLVGQECSEWTSEHGDAAVNLSDAVSLLNHLFLGGPQPIAPFPNCGSGTPADYEELGCESAPEGCR